MTQEHRITAESATIKTMSVEIRVISVNGKQMTLAVFRQLPLRNILDFDGHITGIPWGVVNYCTKDCDYVGRHVHVIWQQGSILCHDMIAYRPEKSVHSGNHEWRELIKVKAAPTPKDKAFAQAYAASYSELANLEQIFIAV